METRIILGPTCSGKTTHINNNFAVDENVIVRIGKFLRESIGIAAMAKDPSPLVCEVTEGWVRCHVRGAVDCCHALKRRLVLDGYPRSIGQVAFLRDHLTLMREVYKSDKNDWPIVVDVLTVPRHVLVTRIHQRANGNKELSDFDLMRLDASISRVDEIVDSIGLNFKGWSVNVNYRKESRA